MRRVTGIRKPCCRHAWPARSEPKQVQQGDSPSAMPTWAKPRWEGCSIFAKSGHWERPFDTKNDLSSKKRRANDKDICRAHPGCRDSPGELMSYPACWACVQAALLSAAFPVLSLPSLWLLLAGTRRTSKATPAGASCTGQCS